ncbi:Nuclear pore complex protein Nup93 [Trichoplax sp. H2]|nr:Nuclear pore complex protein Nup93 [Trichoplax sp. H2]|eukprot:RDD47272.1 Nuclear pore complex protein Nup93 [Trichoplax sp. H2]
MASNTNAVTFDELVQHAEQLNADIEHGLELPRVERSLLQISETVQKLKSKTIHATGEMKDVKAKASMLLGSNGVDLTDLDQDVDILATSANLHPLEPISDSDIQGFIRNERENAMLSAIEEARRNTMEMAEQHQWQYMVTEWEKEKVKILNHLIGSGEDIAVTDDNDGPSSVAIIEKQGVMDAIELSYAREIYIRNERLINGEQVNLIQALREAASREADANIVDIWDLIYEIADIEITEVIDPLALRYEAESQMLFINKARNCLERRYLDYVKKTIYGNLHQAKLGGVPSTYHTVKSFLNITMPNSVLNLEDGLVDDKPVWAMIYYCIRCGDLKAMLNAADLQYLGEITNYLEEFANSPNHSISAPSATKVQLMYKRSEGHSSDPFKRFG